MKIGIFSPYLNILGGGERYVLSLASHWSENNSVCLFWDKQDVLKQINTRLGLEMGKVMVVSNIFGSGNILMKMYESSKYDVIFFLTDGSIPMSFARYNILHFQVPFNPIRCSPIKRMRFNRIVCNSDFTRKNLDPMFSRNASVIYPPVSTVKFQPGNKQKIILTVGRFDSQYRAKKQEVLIDAFAKGYEAGIFKGFKFVLAGGLLDTDNDYYKSLMAKAGRLPVEFYPNCGFETLRKLYAQSSIYWHAAGYGENSPLHMEHFGITTVEAMAAGCVPVVFNGGGLPEVVHDTVDGFVWKNPDTLISSTQKIIDDNVMRHRISEEAKKRAEDFGEDKFYKSYDLILSQLSK
jgi:glycosyltransferase involved in cell wall biosynthesis